MCSHSSSPSSPRSQLMLCGISPRSPSPHKSGHACFSEWAGADKFHLSPLPLDPGSLRFTTEGIRDLPALSANPLNCRSRSSRVPWPSGRASANECGQCKGPRHPSRSVAWLTLLKWRALLGDQRHTNATHACKEHYVLQWRQSITGTLPGCAFHFQIRLRQTRLQPTFPSWTFQPRTPLPTLENAPILSDMASNCGLSEYTRRSRHLVRNQTTMFRLPRTWGPAYGFAL